MEFKSSGQTKSKFVRLQFYLTPPVETIELNQLEEYAIDRLKVLKCVEVLGQDYVRGTREYDEKMMSELSKLGTFGKSMTLTSYLIKNINDDIRKDIISHFILQVAYCRSDDLRRWFIQQEIDLFRFRFLNERINSSNGAEVIEKFLSENNLNFTYISDSERSKLTNQLIAGTAAPGINVDTTAFYKVRFTDVTDLVRSRRVFVALGYAYVPDSDLVSLVVSHFRTSLSCSLSHLGLTLGSKLVSEENRILPLLSSLSNRYLGEDYSSKGPLLGSVKADQVDAFGRQPGVFPPCMAQLHEALKTHHHLRHSGRMQYGLFLKGIGLPLDESLKFWSSSFAPKYDSDSFAKSYAYNIRHNYGKEGKRADYTPYSCVKIISGSVPGAGDYHGCPFKHMDSDLLRQRLLCGGRLNLDTVDTIIKHANNRLFHLSCREYFRAMHKLGSDDMVNITIHHPNQYFDESQKVLRGATVLNKLTKVQRVKLPNSGEMDIDDSLLVEASIIVDDEFDLGMEF